MSLKPCPCGKVPTKLWRFPPTVNWITHAAGDCCGKWLVCFNDVYPNTSDENAEAAWNAAPRAEKEVSGPLMTRASAWLAMTEEGEQSLHLDKEDAKREGNAFVLPLYPHPQDINAMFECEDNGLVGRTSVPVKRVEQQDDGSHTVVLDYWPKVK